MALFPNVERVKYLCSCGVYLPLCKLFFCRFCQESKCRLCVQHEVDGVFCPCCMESLPISEALMKNQTCFACYTCPCCQHSLSMRATSVQIANPEDSSKPILKKVYYMGCTFCRWTTRDAGLPDKAVATQRLDQRNNTSLEHIQSVYEYYKQIGVEEKNERERQQFSKKKTYLYLKERYTRRRSTLVSKLNALDIESSPQTLKSSDLKPTDNVIETPEALPESYWTHIINISAVSTINQRLNDPEFQPMMATSMFPKSKGLSIKRLLRCKTCDHSLIKSEYMPQSIKFKLHYIALYVVPEIKLVSEPKIVSECQSEFLLAISNMQDRPVNIHLEALDIDDERVAGKCNTKLCVDSSVFQIAACDYTDVDDIQSVKEYVDDPSFIVQRKGHRVRLKASVNVPEPSSINLVAPLILHFDLVNSSLTSTGAPAVVEPANQSLLVLIDLGKTINM